MVLSSWSWSCCYCLYYLFFSVNRLTDLGLSNSQDSPTKCPPSPPFTDSWLRQFQARSSSPIEFLGQNSSSFHSVANGLRSGQVVHAESPRWTTRTLEQFLFCYERGWCKPTYAETFLSRPSLKALVSYLFLFHFYSISHDVIKWITKSVAEFYVWFQRI